MHPKRVLQVCDRFFHFHFSLHYDMRWLTLVSLALTLSWRRPLSYRNQSNDLQSNNDLRHERVKRKLKAKEYLPNHLLFLRIIILILLWILTEKKLFSEAAVWRCFVKNIHRKTPVLESLFDKVAGDSNTGVFLWILQNV